MCLPQDINNHNWVVGFVQDFFPDVYMPVVFVNSEPFLLGTLAGYEYSVAYGVNDKNIVVGTCWDREEHKRAWYFSAGVVRDLNDRIDPSSGWILERAMEINEKNFITGSGTYNGEPRRFILIP